MVTTKRCSWMVLIGVLLACPSCDKQERPLAPPVTAVPVPFVELPVEERPPCVTSRSPALAVVIASAGDYERARRRYAPQGEYVRFEPGARYRLPYLPLDVDEDGVIGPGDLVIYVDKPFEVTVNGERLRVRARPLWVQEGRVLLFAAEPPHTMVGTVPVDEILSVDPATGEVTFVPALEPGTRVSISARRRLYDEYLGRKCSMAEFDFAKRAFIGRNISGDGCLKGFDVDLVFDAENRQLLHFMRPRLEDDGHGCPEVAVTLTSWIAFEPPAGECEVVFVPPYE